MSTEKSCLRYIERSILDTAHLYGIEEVAQGEILCFPQMAGWFEGEKIGGDFLVRVNQTAENCELINGKLRSRKVCPEKSTKHSFSIDKYRKSEHNKEESNKDIFRNQKYKNLSIEREMI